MTWAWTEVRWTRDCQAEFQGYRVFLFAGSSAPDGWHTYRCQVVQRGQDMDARVAQHWPITDAHVKHWPITCETIDEAQHYAEQLVEEWYAQVLAARLLASPLPPVGTDWKSYWFSLPHRGSGGRDT